MNVFQSTGIHANCIRQFLFVLSLLHLSVACTKVRRVPLPVDAGPEQAVAPSATPDASVEGTEAKEATRPGSSAFGTVFCRVIAGKGRLPIRDLYVKTRDLSGYGYVSGMAEPSRGKNIECEDSEISGSAICAEGFVVAPVDKGAHLSLAFNVRQDRWTEATGDRPIPIRAYSKPVGHIDVQYSADGVGEPRVCVKASSRTYCAVVVPPPPPNGGDTANERPEELTEAEVATPSKLVHPKSYAYRLSASQFIEQGDAGTGPAWDGSSFETFELRLGLVAQTRRLYSACLKSVQVTPSTFGRSATGGSSKRATATSP